VRESKKYKLVFDIRRVPNYHWQSQRNGYYGEYEVGIITVAEGFGNLFSLEAYHTDILRRYLNEVNVHMIISEEKAKELARDLVEKSRLLTEEQDKLAKKKIENQEAIKHIPKFIKWLFKIK
jgi:RNase adaptor protein for sRNA GlmZ degradation